MDDQRCVDGHCKAWGDGAFDAFDPTCTLPAEPFTVAPRVLCHWPPAGVPMTEGPEAWRWARRVASTIVAATFLPAPSELAQPPTWLVFATGSVLSSSNDPAPPGTWQAGGVLRVLDPQSCTLIDTLDEVPVAAWFQPPAIGDLDGDKVPEIVAQAWDEQVPGAPNYQSSGRLVAWKYDPASKRFRVWRQSTVAGQPEADLVFSAAYQQMSGPTIADLDNDGKPEVVLAGRVYDSELRRLTGQAPPTTTLMLSKATGPFLIQQDVIADLDGDGRAELIYGHDIFSWTATGWQRATFFKPPVALGVGHAVVADMGDFGEPPAPDGKGKPEIVVVGYDGVRIQSIDGRILKQFALPTSDRGGSAPSIANLDADATPEIMVGVDRGLFVYDLQCDSDTPGPECGRDAAPAAGLPPLPRGVRWADRPPVDAWDYMGATTFDFDGDGKLEVIYADECFLRVYDGETGKVIYSHWRPSRTASEVPIVVGTNAGADTVIAIGLHTSYFCSQAVGADGYDPQFPGLACVDDRECFGPAGSCKAGRCRCTQTSECCAAGQDCAALGYACRPADDSEGNTCRAVRVPDASGFSASGALEEGIDVLTDSRGRWSAARPVWNQDAYSVTNVNDNGTIPRTSEVKANWLQPGLNNFRSNVPGRVPASAAVDLTARKLQISCTGSTVSKLSAELCNRGARAATTGQVLRFGSAGLALCQAATTDVLLPGQCVLLSCTPAQPPVAGASVVATADPDDLTRECGSPNDSASVIACP